MRGVEEEADEEVERRKKARRKSRRESTTSEDHQDVPQKQSIFDKLHMKRHRHRRSSKREHTTHVKDQSNETSEQIAETSGRRRSNAGRERRKSIGLREQRARVSIVSENAGDVHAPGTSTEPNAATAQENLGKLDIVRGAGEAASTDDVQITIENQREAGDDDSLEDFTTEGE